MPTPVFAALCAALGNNQCSIDVCSRFHQEPLLRGLGLGGSHETLRAINGVQRTTPEHATGLRCCNTIFVYQCMLIIQRRNCVYVYLTCLSGSVLPLRREWEVSAGVLLE